MAWEVIKQYKAGDVAVNVSQDKAHRYPRFSIQCGTVRDGPVLPFIPVRVRIAAVGRAELSDVFKRLKLCLDEAELFIAHEAHQIEGKRLDQLVERDTQWAARAPQRKRRG